MGDIMQVSYDNPINEAEVSLKELPNKLFNSLMLMLENLKDKTMNK